MEGSLQVEQTILDELQALRVRVSELEHITEVQRQKLIVEQHTRLEVEAVLHHVQEDEVSLRQQLEQLKMDAACQSAEQARELETIFDTLTDPLCVYDGAGNIIRMNQAFCTLMGIDAHSTYSTLSMRERGASIQVADEKGQILPSERWPLYRVLHGVVLTEKNTQEITVATPDGRRLQLSANGAPIRDKQGNITGAVTIYRNVTERRNLERRSHDTLEALLAMAEVLVKGVDHRAAGKDCTHLLLSQIVHRLAKLARRVLDCRCIGVTLVEAATDQLHPLTIVGVSSDERKRWLARLAETPLSNYINDVHQLKDLRAGKPLWLEINEQETPPKIACLLLPMRIGTQLSGLLSLDYGERRDHLTDEEMAVAQAVSRLIGLVLERERLLQERAEAHANELALREANRRTDEFLSITSHELRTPLTTINGNIQLAKRRIRTLTKDDPQEEFYSKLDLVVELLGRAERQVRVQNRLVSDLLDVSRIQSNRLELHADACNLAIIVSECVEDQRASNPSRTLTLCLPDEAIPVIADPDRIGQVVTNYLTNALKYSTADMPVAVHLTVEPGLARVAVHDRGPGLPPEEQQRLWQRFYRVAGIPVRSGSGVGLGLGLYICRSIIELHYGKVGVQSSPGQGSTFWFTLPLIESASNAENMDRIL